MKKNFTLKTFVFAFLFVCLTLTVIGCKNKTKNGYQLKDTDYGVYFADEGYVLTIATDGLTIGHYGDSKQKSSIEYDDTYVIAKFAEPYGETKIQIASGEGTMLLGRKTYKISMKDPYTYTFVTDGEFEGIKEWTVAQGWVITAPSTAKEGYVFDGWYESESYEVKHDFTTAVTKSETFYAHFIEKGENEFTVSFDLNYDGAPAYTETVETANGIAYNLPTPTRADYDFAGWWISNDNGTTLVSEYSGEKLEAATTLYAKWTALDALNLTVNETGITWDSVGVGANYTVKVYLPGSETAAVTTTVTDNKYDYTYTEPGEYKFEVTYKTKTTTATYAYNVLAKVTEYTVEGNTVKFAKVENATNYKLTFTCGEVAHNHNSIDLGDAAEFDLTNCVMAEGGFSFVVTASATGYLTSTSEAIEFSRKLEAVSQVTSNATEDDLTVAWGAVENAEQYVVTLVNGTNEIANITTEDLTVSLKNYPGNYTVKVVAAAKSWINGDEATKDITNDKVAAPTNVKVLGSTIEWDAIDGVTKYVVKIGNDEVESSTNSYVFTGDVTGSVDVKVKAENGYYSSPITVSAEFKAPRYENGSIVWDAVFGVASYNVSANGGEAKVVEGNSVNVNELTGLVSGNNVFSVSYGTAEAKTVSETLYAITFNANGGVSIGTKYIAHGDAFEFTTTRIYYNLVGWYDAQDAKYDKQYFTDDKDLELTALWKGVDFTITLNLGTQPGTVESTTIIVEYGKGFALPIPSATDTSWTFNGYKKGGVAYTDFTGESAAVYTDTEDITLTAEWVSLFTFELNEKKDGYSVSKSSYTNRVKELTIPASYNGLPVTQILGQAFAGCNQVEVINIPNTLTYVETGLGGALAANSCFTDCTKLKAVNVYDVEGNHDKAYISSTGLLLYYNANNGGKLEIIYVPTGLVGVVEIPVGVEVIPVKTFYRGKVLGENVPGITEVIIPWTVTSIEDKAFQANYYSLTKVTFQPTPQGETERPLTIGQLAFGNNFRLTSITLPKRLASFGLDAFGAISAFDASGVRSIEVEEGSEKFFSINGVLYENVSGTKKLAYYPKQLEGAFEVPAGVTEIEPGAFRSSHVTSITIPGHVKRIGAYAFETCYQLTAINFLGEASDADLVIENNAFYGAGNMTTITIPANVKNIGANAFGSIKSLQTVNINCVEGAVFANSAFLDVAGACSVSTVNIGKDCPEFNIAGVIGSDNLTYVNVAEGNPNFASEDGVLFNSDKTQILYFPAGRSGTVTIPDNITSIPANMFKGKGYITKVIIGKNVTSIGASAFEDCRLLAEIEFLTGNDAELTIGNRAFYNCASLTTISLSDKITTIGDSTFGSCIKLESIKLPANLTSIGNKAFDGCVALTSFDASGTRLANIKELAFNGCTSLATVKLPNTVLFEESLQSNSSRDPGAASDPNKSVNTMHAFEGCTKLADLTIAEGGENYATIQNVIYKLEDGVATNLYYAPISAKGIADANGVLTVPKTVTKIQNLAFYKNAVVKTVVFEDREGADIEILPAVFRESSVVTVTFPEGVTAVSRGMFHSCASLTTVNLPSTIKTIEKIAFYSCTKLSAINFAEGGTEPFTLADCTSTTSTFYKTTALTTIKLPARTTYIGNYVFSANTTASNSCGLVSIEIPRDCQKIGNYAFQNAQKLTTVTYAEGCALANGSVGNNAFDNAALSVVTIIAKTNGTNAYNCKKATKVVVMNSAVLNAAGLGTGNTATVVEFEAGYNKDIPTKAFTGLAKLKSVVIPAGVKNIGASAFASCGALTTVTFEAGSELVSIGASAFSGTSVSALVIPTKETGTITLGASLFSVAKAPITVTLSKNVQTIKNVFDGCTTAITLNIASDNTTLSIVDGNVVGNGGAIELILNPTANAEGVYTVPAALTAVGSNAFANKPGIKKLIVPNTVTSLAANAFANMPDLEEVVFAEDCVATLSNGLFLGCKKLTTITFANNVTAIPDECFSGCSALTTITLPNATTTLGAKAFYGSGITTLDLTNTKITTIGANAFETCAKLTAITFPVTLTTINDKAFLSATALTEVAIPKYVNKLGVNVFQKATALTSISFDAEAVITALPNYMCDGCTALTTVSLPASITTFGTYLFQNCSSITSIDLSHITTKSLGNYMFNGCTKLASIKLPVGIEHLGTYTFQNTGFETFEIPSTVKFIDSALRTSAMTSSNNVYLFNKCANLTSVTLHDKIEYIGGYVFANCPKLTYVDIPSNVQLIGQSCFENTPITRISIPESCVYLGASAFKNTKLVNVYIPSKFGNVNIGYGPMAGAQSLFEGCTLLEKVILPEGQEFIYNSMFKGCTSLKTIDLPDSVTYIGWYAFQNSGLVSITIPEKVKALGWSPSEYASDGTPIASAFNNVPGETFAGCKDLESVTFDGLSKCLYFAQKSFYGCAKLTSIELPINTVMIANSAFENSGLETFTLPPAVQYLGANITKGTPYETKSQA